LIITIYAIEKKTNLDFASETICWKYSKCLRNLLKYYFYLFCS